MASRFLLVILRILLLFSCVTHAVPIAPDPLINWKSTQDEGITRALNSFSISQVKNPKWAPRPGNFTEIYVNTLRKYRLPVPDALHSRDVEDSGLEARQYDFSLAGYKDGTAWAFPIQIGTPAQTLYVLFDTGSPDLWVFSDAMPVSESSGHIVYSAGNSTSSQLMAGQTFDLGYGSGSASGNVHTDVLSLGAAISGYPMETALDVSSSFYVQYGISGLWGMSLAVYQTQGPATQPTWLAFANAYLGISLFTVNYNYNGGGVVNFGSLDSTQYTGSVYYTPASSWLYAYSPLWGINITSYSVGTGSSKTFSVGAVLDTGTTLLAFPTSVTRAYWAQVTGAVLQDGSYIFPCNATLPDLHFVIQGGISVSIHGPYMNANGPGATAPNTWCNGALQTSSSDPFSIFGLPLFQSMFVVFDYRGSRAGFATKNLS